MAALKKEDFEPMVVAGVSSARGRRNGLMQKIDRFLKLMNDRGASDFHLTVGRPPMLRASGSMETIRYRTLTEADFTEMMQADHAAAAVGRVRRRPATSTSPTRFRAWRAIASISSGSSAAPARSSASSRRRS